jgi:Tfp pilus assembly protein PilN
LRPVNLLPARYRPARATGERRGIGYIAVGVLAVLLLMILGYVLTNNAIKDANNEKAQADADYAAAQAKIGTLQPFGDFAQLKEARYNAVKNVALLRFDYERLMREVALVLPKDTHLTTFSATSAGSGETATSGTTTATGPTLSVAGCAPSHLGVATVVVRLRQLHDVTDVSLQNSTKAATGGTSGTGSVCPVSWAATITFQPETGTVVQQPVPARLGGGQ